MLWIRLVVEIQMANGIPTEPCYHSLIRFRLWRRRSLLQWTVYCGNKLFYSCQWVDSVLNLVERDTSRKKKFKNHHELSFFPSVEAQHFFGNRMGCLIFLLDSIILIIFIIFFYYHDYYYQGWYLNMFWQIKCTSY